MKNEQLYESCTLCPRRCKVNRLAGGRGYCRETSELVVARAALHMWEEPCISGEEGSGAVFFSGCAMGCVFCQNHNIAEGKAGKKITVERLAEIFLELQEKKANNINLVTPSHYVVSIIEVIDLAREKGLKIPIVYNCSGFELPETLRLLEGYVDIYLPDFKYRKEEVAKRYANAPRYADYAKEALKEMFRQVGTPEFDDRGMMKKGMIVRHLILPEHTEDSKEIVKYLYDTYGDSIYISIMNQYTPLTHVAAYEELNRPLTDEEYDEVVDYAIDLGVENGFIQEGETAKDSFIPEFNNEGV
ncbi:radical SAM domain protein [Lachnospiraceae bacterium KM106-2]|nr:radical SAM domain protein [Lachnospiraceae bacterium KM106-2]